jgi:uncharacterized membrane protein YhaH (DUF805 family)
MNIQVRRLISFRGRISRGAFWGLTLMNYAVGFLAMLAVWFYIGLTSDVDAMSDAEFEAEFEGWLAFIVLFSMVWQLSNFTRRWHDHDKSGLWCLIGLVPFIGSLWLFIETALSAGQALPNRYGAPNSGSPFERPVAVAPPPPVATIRF